VNGDLNIEEKMVRLLTALLILATSLVGEALSREWIEESIALPAWNIEVEAVMGCDGTELVGSTTSTGWGEECQVSFLMPAPEYGGPWLIEYVAVFISGSESRDIIVRSASDIDTAPDTEVARPTLFTPSASAWPPTEWTYVKLQTEGSEWPDYLMVNEGELITIGFPLLDGDQVGLAATQSNTKGWSFYDGDWVNDTDDWNLTVSVRISLADTGLRPIDKSTWGVIKNMFN
jgi:hypothetical protein